MKNPVREIVEEGFKGTMDVRVLPALAAIRALKRCAAVKAVRFMRMPVPFSGRRLDRAADYSPGQSIAKCFKVAHLKPPWPDIRRRDRRMLAVRGMARIGLLGGSFNPAHAGHRHISLEAMRSLGLDEVWWLVSPGNPLKEDAKDMAPFRARLASAKQMVRRSPIRVSDFEQRMGTRYTIDTVRKLKRSHPEHDFIWLLGSDTLPNFHLWRDWRGLAREVPIAVIRRPGYDSAAHAARAMGWLRRFVHPSSQARRWTQWSAPAILFLRLKPDTLSATAIRAHDPHWHLRTNARLERSYRSGSPMFRRRTLDRTSS